MQWIRAMWVTILGYTEVAKSLVSRFSLFWIPFLPLEAQASTLLSVACQPQPTTTEGAVQGWPGTGRTLEDTGLGLRFWGEAWCRTPRKEVDLSVVADVHLKTDLVAAHPAGNLSWPLSFWPCIGSCHFLRSGNVGIWNFAGLAFIHLLEYYPCVGHVLCCGLGYKAKQRMIVPSRTIMVFYMPNISSECHIFRS